MKHKIFILIILLSSFALSAQISGRVTYGEKIVERTLDTTKINSNQVKSIIKYQMEATKKALNSTHELYELIFNKTASNFEIIPFLDNDADPNLRRVLSKGRYYSDIKSKLNYHNLFAFDRWFIIKSNRNTIKWKITKTSKSIGDYICFKAIGETKNSKGKTSKITAWFSPSLPFSFGPKNYGGLPGLILELVERGHSFYAINIKLTNDNFKLKKPNKGKEVSFEEFNRIGEKLFSNFKN